MTNRLKEIRENRGISLRALATSSGYGVSTINNYENGTTSASREFLKTMADVLGTTVDEIVMESASVAASRAVETSGLPEWARLLLGRLDTLPEEERNRMLRAFHLSLDLHIRNPKSPPMIPVPPEGREVSYQPKEAQADESSLAADVPPGPGATVQQRTAYGARRAMAIARGVRSQGKGTVASPTGSKASPHPGSRSESRQ